MKFPFVDIIHPQGNKFVRGAKTMARGDSKINDSPDSHKSEQLSQ